MRRCRVGKYEKSKKLDKPEEKSKQNRIKIKNNKKEEMKRGIRKYAKEKKFARSW